MTDSYMILDLFFSLFQRCSIIQQENIPIALIVVVVGVIMLTVV